MSKALAKYFYIVGPTACGKSDFAMTLAKNLRRPIFNCDSVQVFEGVNIGTAMPTQKDFSEVPHFLFSYVDPPNDLTVADYLKDVVDVIVDKQIKNPIFVGGSGFYLQALHKGLYPQTDVSADIKAEVEQSFREKGPIQLFSWIQQRDPEFAKKISSNDHYRIKRAVAVMKAQDLTMTQLKQKLATENHSPLPEHTALKIGFNDERPRLRERVIERTKKMLAQGWIDEVKALRQQGLSNWAPLKSVGYKEVQNYLDGKIAKADLAEQIVTATMQLIKKQQTWFKRDPDIRWFRPDQTEQALQWGLDQVEEN